MMLVMPNQKEGSMERTQQLSALTALSHEFGGPRFVHGGGGNTSVKENGILWIKPSGCSLARLEPEDFIGVDRRRLADLFRDPLPADTASREEEARRLLTEAVIPGSAGRPSVETLLHDFITSRFIVHTHPALVNGLTCAVNGRAACADLFPEALWIDYVDPGCTLARRVLTELEAHGYIDSDGAIVIFLQNHGVFVGGENPEIIRAAYDRIMGTLIEHYTRRDLNPDRGEEPDALLLPGPDASPAAPAAVREVAARLREVLPGDTAPHLAVGVSGEPASGPLTPDHIVYAGSEPLSGEPIPAAVAAYRERFGYDPKVIALHGVICGVGKTPEQALLALEMARDGAEIIRLAGAFGGVRYLDLESSRFIEGWEVERYRQRQI